MLVEIDFESDEALYMQVRNQIILGIATAKLREGQTLPSVRNLAEMIGINMHTVNKAYALLREEGFLQLDRRRGAVIALDIDKLQALSAVRRDLKVLLAWARCKRISCAEMHEMVDAIYQQYDRNGD